MSRHYNGAFGSNPFIGRSHVCVACRFASKRAERCPTCREPMRYWSRPVPPKRDAAAWAAIDRWTRRRLRIWEDKTNQPNVRLQRCKGWRALLRAAR